MVMFIGGATSSEVSALRFLSRHNRAGAQIIVGTTKLTSGDSLLSTLSDSLDPPVGMTGFKRK